MQTIRTGLLPFAQHHKSLEIPEGLTLEQIVNLVIPRQIRGLDVVVNVGDQLVPKAYWRSIKPKRHTFVGVNVVPAGGGGKKNPLVTILSIAIAIAAPYAAASLGTTIGLSVTGSGVLTAAQTAFFTGAVRIGISMVGYLAISMLSSTPKQTASVSESRTQFIEGASNAINRFGVIPINLGTNRMFPPQAVLPFTETSGRNQYVRQVFTYGYGTVIVSQRKFGETLVSEYEGVEFEDKLEGDLSTGTALYANDVYQDGLAVTLSSAANYILRTTQTNADEAIIDITFNQGLGGVSAKGNKYIVGVNFSIEYALTGTSDWSNGDAGLSVGSQSLAVPQPVKDFKENPPTLLGGFGLILLNKLNGVAKISLDDTPPEDHIRIGSYTTNFDRSSIVVTDERASYIPGTITSGFAMSVAGTNISIASGVLAPAPFSVRDSTAQALRVSKRLVFPTAGQYDVRIKRLTGDSSSDEIRDVATWTALKSISYVQPVKKQDISGTAMRIKATDQISGTVDRYNAVVSTVLLYWDGADWVSGVSSNPAAIYRYVLQSEAFVKRLDDSRIDLTKLQEWSEYCDDNNLTYDRVIDYETSIDDVLRDIAAAGMATPHKVDGNYSVIIDNERPDIVGMITPRNSWGYKGNINYPEVPHALRVQFRNADKGYEVDERIVYADGYDETNATEFERLEFSSCTNADLAWFYGKRYFATAILQPEIHSWNMDFENLTLNRGDRAVLVNDVILVGVGQARIKSVIDDGTNITGFVIDDVVEIPNSNQFGVRVRQSDATGFDYYSLSTSIGSTDTFTLSTPVPIADGPQVDSLCTFTEFGKELDVIITEIKMNKDQSASITAINYAPERFTATTGSIPPFNSNVTLPIGFTQPQAPLLASDIKSDESVMVRNSDGSYQTRILIPLTNRNEPSVVPQVLVQIAGGTQWEQAEIVSATANLVTLTGLQDGSVYNFQIRYQRQTGLQLLSTPLTINGVTFVGAGSTPANVQNFKSSTTSETILFEWTPNTEIDISHYVMRFSGLTSGAVWETSQSIADNINDNRISLPVQSGTFFIKAVDLAGNQSTDAAVIINFNAGALKNVVETFVEQPSWDGAKENVIVVSNKLRLDDTGLPGYYYFTPSNNVVVGADNVINGVGNNVINSINLPFDLGDIYESTLSSSILATGYRNVGGVFIRSVSSMRTLESVRGFISPASWQVNLQMNLDGAGWEPFTAGNRVFQTAEFRLELLSFETDVTPDISVAEVTIDMPDRIERDTDVALDAGGTSVTYTLPFRNNPAVNITLQDGEADDRLEFTAKTSSGFTLKVYNVTAAAYVARTFDYVSVGYGRVL